MSEVDNEERGWADAVRSKASAVLDSTTRAIGTAADATKTGAKTAGQAVGRAAGTTGKAIGSAAGATKDAASRVSARAGEHFDTISGAAVLELVEQRVELQARYNDVLAAKLDEALNRIDELEREVAALKTRSSDA